MPLIRIGTYVNDTGRIGLDGWRNGKVRDAFSALAREWSAFSDALASLKAAGKLTPDGVIETATPMARDRLLPAIKAADEAAKMAANEPAAVKSGLIDRFERESSPRDIQKRIELRQVMREGKADAKLAMSHPFDEAVIEMPPQVSGVPGPLYDQIVASVLNRKYPGALTAADEVAQSGEVVAGAADGARGGLQQAGFGFLLQREAAAAA